MPEVDFAAILNLLGSESSGISNWFPKLERLIRRLLEAEGISIIQSYLASRSRIQYDLVGKVTFTEPGGLIRSEELWGFDIKPRKQSFIGIQVIREAAAMYSTIAIQSNIDVVCIITNTKLTSIALSESKEFPFMRIWDRDILEKLIAKHSKIIEEYLTKENAIEFFDSFKVKLELLSGNHQAINPNPISEYYITTSDRLARCPTGQANFAQYEKLGTEIIENIFSNALKIRKPQSKTLDGTLRRDVLFSVRGSHNFWEMVRRRFNAQFVIVDFKNYKDLITPDEINDVAKYPSKGLGRFVIVVTRQGRNKSVFRTQVRLFKEEDKMIVVINDEQLLEMIQRKNNGDAPEDFLQDLTDEIMAEDAS